MPNDGFQENASITRTAGTPTTLRLNINASVFGFTDTSSDIEFFSIRRTLTVNGTALLNGGWDVSFTGGGFQWHWRRQQLRRLQRDAAPRKPDPEHRVFLA